MSKSRHNHKWFDDEEEELHMGHNRAKFSDDKKSKLEERRNMRKQVHAEKTQILTKSYYGDEE